MSFDDNLKKFENACISDLFNTFTNNWHETGPVEGQNSIELPSFMHCNHFFNYSLWHEEDEARRLDVDDSIIAQVKRNIDGFNQKRNDMIQKIDEELVHTLDSLNIELNSGSMNSETPGSMIDRISILSLKIYHMNEIAVDKSEKESTRSSCAGKVKTLEQQQRELESCLKNLLKDIKNGTRHFNVYFQFKMYNDPELNQAVKKNS